MSEVKIYSSTENIARYFNAATPLTEEQLKLKGTLEQSLLFLSRGSLFARNSVIEYGKALGLGNNNIENLIIDALSVYGLENAYKRALDRVKSSGEDDGNDAATIGMYLGYGKEKIEVEVVEAKKEYSEKRFDGGLKALSRGEIIYLSDAWEQGTILGLENTRHLIVNALSEHGLEKAYTEALGFISNHGDNRYGFVVKEIGSYLGYTGEKINNDLSAAYKKNVGIRYKESLVNLAQGHLSYKKTAEETGKELKIPGEQLQESIEIAYREGLPKAYQMALVKLEHGTSGKEEKFGFLYEIEEEVDSMIEEIRKTGRVLGYEESKVNKDIIDNDKNKDQRRPATSEDKEFLGIE